jgi:hypothetical protein
MCKRNPRSRQSVNSAAEPQSARKGRYAIALFDTGMRSKSGAAFDNLSVR